MKKIDYYVHRFCGSGVQTGHSRMCVLSLFCNIWSWKTQNWELESSEDSFTLAVVAVRWLGRLQFLSIWVSPCDISKWTGLCFLEWANRVPQSMHSKEREPGRSCPLYDIDLGTTERHFFFLLWWSEQAQVHQVQGEKKRLLMEAEDIFGIKISYNYIILFI